MKRDSIEKGLLRAAVIISDEAADEAPVDTGNLRQSIHPGEVESFGDIISVEMGVDPLELDSDVNYGVFIHFGTGIYGPHKKRFKGKIPGTGWRMIDGIKPDPFFDRAIDIVGDEAMKQLDPAIQAEFDDSIFGKLFN